MEGWGGTGRLGKVQLCSDTGGVVVWGRDVFVVGANVAEARGNPYVVPETGEKVEGKKAEGQFLAESGGGQSASGSGDTTATYLL